MSEGGKRAVVTGAGRGIGAAIARALGASGYRVGVNYRSSKAGAEAVLAGIRESGGDGILLPGDVSVPADMDAVFTSFVAAYGGVDLVVNNAGVTEFAPFLEMTEETFDRVVSTDFRGCYFVAQRGARQMVAQGGGGVIINIGSNHQSGCWPGASVYAASKAALNRLAGSLALELAPHRIRVNTIAPGYTEVENYRTADPAVWREISRRIPLGRLGDPDGVAQAVLYLASDAASYITGTCLVIDGGVLLPVVSENPYC